MSEIRFGDEARESSELAFFDEAEFAETLSACWGIGPLQVCVASISKDAVTVEIKLAGIRIGSGTLTAGNSRICASANVGVVKAKVCVTGDFPNSTVWVEGEVCTRKFPSGWSCRRFKTKILSW